MYAGHRSDASVVVFYPHALVKAAVHIGGGGRIPLHTMLQAISPPNVYTSENHQPVFKRFVRRMNKSSRGFGACFGTENASPAIDD